MKKLISFILITLLLLSFTACTQSNKVLNSLGKHTEICFYTHGEFQDYTDYAKYQFDSPNIDDNKYLKKIDADSKASFENHMDNYEPFVIEYCSEDITYDFDRSVITDTDYIYIYDDPDYPEYGNYSIWFYDFETEILYYFHTNI